MASLNEANNALREQLVSMEKLGTKATRGRKRKSDDRDGDAVESTRPTTRKTRTKVNAGAKDQSVSNAAFSITDDEESLRNDEAGKQVVRHLYNLQRLCAEACPEEDRLGHHLSQLASTLQTLIATSFKPPRRNNVQALFQAKSAADTIGKIRTVIRVSARCFTAILHGLTMLSESAGSRTLRSQVVYQLARVFSSSLDGLSNSVQASVDSGQSVIEKDRQSSRSIASSTGSDRSLLEILTNFIAALLKSLEPRHCSHEDLFEGFLFLLLKRLGQTLYLFTFSHPRSDNLADEMHLGLNDSCSPPDDVQMQAARAFAPSLIALLKTAMTLAPKHFRSNAVSSHDGVAASTETMAVPQRSMLSKAALDRLQRTLVKCTFGSEGLDRETFADCLKMPQNPKTVTYGPRGKDSERNGKDDGDEEKFTEQLWELLGWDILAEAIH